MRELSCGRAHRILGVGVRSVLQQQLHHLLAAFVPHRLHQGCEPVRRPRVRVRPLLQQLLHNRGPSQLCCEVERCVVFLRGHPGEMRGPRKAVGKRVLLRTFSFAPLSMNFAALGSARRRATSAVSPFRAAIRSCFCGAESSAVRMRGELGMCYCIVMQLRAVKFTADTEA